MEFGILSRTSVRHCSLVAPGARRFGPPLASDQASVVLSARSKTSLSCPLAAFICSAVTFGGRFSSVSSKRLAPTERSVIEVGSGVTRTRSFGLGTSTPGFGRIVGTVSSNVSPSSPTDPPAAASDASTRRISLVS